MDLIKTTLLIFCFTFGLEYLAFAQGKATLYGVCNDNTIADINVDKPAMFWWSRYRDHEVLGSSQKDELGRFYMAIPLDSPRMLYLQMINGSWPIFVTPGDSISFVISQESKYRYNVVFNGKNSPHYNYFSMGSNITPFTFRGEKPEDNIPDYAAQVQDYYNTKKTFLDTYAKNHLLSSEFLRYAINQIEYERYFLLNSIQNKDSKSLNTGPVNSDSLDWNKDYLLNNYYFLRSLVLKYIYQANNDWDHFSQIFNKILLSLKGRTRQYMVVTVLGMYSQNPNKEFASIFLNAITVAKSYLTDQVYLNQLVAIETEYNKIYNPFPSDVLNKTFLKDLEGKVLSLKALLELNQSKAIYFDFWASWCSPCREDISQSGEAKAYLEGVGINFLYISVDKASDEVKWKKASKNDKITKGQYLLVGGISSPLSKYLQINEIPRYVLIDSLHKVNNINAPRPVSYDGIFPLKEEIERLNK